MLDEVFGFLIFAFFLTLSTTFIYIETKDIENASARKVEDFNKVLEYENSTFYGRSKAYLLCLCKYYSEESLSFPEGDFNCTEELIRMNLTQVKISCKVFGEEVEVP